MPNVDFKVRDAIAEKFDAEVSVEQTGRSYDTLSPYTITVKKGNKTVVVKSVKTLPEVIAEIASKLK